MRIDWRLGTRAHFPCAGCRRRKFWYNTCDVCVGVTDANGIVTEYENSREGTVTLVTRRDGAETLASVAVSYDAADRIFCEGDTTYTYHPDGQLAIANYCDGGRAGRPLPAALSAFGESLHGTDRSTPTPSTNASFFTGKPYVEGLGHAFLMRNYRASLAKWQTADPMGYPDGWNALAYCGNGVTSAVELEWMSYAWAGSY